MSYCNQLVTALWPTFQQGSLLERLGKDELPRLRLWFSAARHGLVVVVALVVVVPGNRPRLLLLMAGPAVQQLLP